MSPQKEPSSTESKAQSFTTPETKKIIDHEKNDSNISQDKTQNNIDSEASTTGTSMQTNQTSGGAN
jgi:hypothetical protein